MQTTSALFLRCTRLSTQNVQDQLGQNSSTERARLAQVKFLHRTCKTSSGGIPAQNVQDQPRWMKKRPLLVRVFEQKITKKGLSSLVFLNQKFKIFGTKSEFFPIGKIGIRNVPNFNNFIFPQLHIKKKKTKIRATFFLKFTPNFREKSGFFSTFRKKIEIFSKYKKNNFSLASY